MANPKLLTMLVAGIYTARRSLFYAEAPVPHTRIQLRDRTVLRVYGRSRWNNESFVRFRGSKIEGEDRSIMKCKIYGKFYSIFFSHFCSEFSPSIQIPLDKSSILDNPILDSVHEAIRDQSSELSKIPRFLLDSKRTSKESLTTVNPVVGSISSRRAKWKVSRSSGSKGG